MSMRQPESVDATRLWDKECVKWRLKELTRYFIEKFVKEDLEKFAMEHKKAWKPVPRYPYNSCDTRDMFYERARGEALKILEAERQAFVDYHAERIKKTLNVVMKRLNFLVFSELGKGKVYVERMLVPSGEGGYDERDVSYFEHYPEGIQILQQIEGVKSRLSEFQDYVPYFNKELSDLWKETTELATLEVIWKNDKEKEKQKKSGIESMGDKKKKSKGKGHKRKILGWNL